ncbi:MAG: hypothetical protein QHC40_15400 [Sphingobium sp.]|uniref:hypothetical protein n=1 Tax=Sphingomonadales TaxID=204457 RepID=UPI0002C130B8|nr:hypothetical protein [Sphingomonas sp. MM-1]AGH47748.1 hypothetical protein G432_00090 [Sphingomonas sp. MM-1]MDX3901879.1 hypothetical protein [Sphingobium sp.]
MMKTLAAALAFSALGIAGCSAEDVEAAQADNDARVTRQQPAASQPMPRDVTDKPSPTPGYDWHLRIDESIRTRPATLAYEVSDTDRQPLTITCEEGSSRLFAEISGGPADLAKLTLTSGDQTLQLKGETRPTEIPEMPHFVSEEIAGDAPLVTAFAANGWLRMTAKDMTTDMAASPKGAKAVADFVKHCTRPYSPWGE